MKAAKVIIGVALLLASLFGGLKLLSTDFVLITEYPLIIFHNDIFVPLIVFLSAAAAAAFFTPRCFQFYLLLISAFSGFFQIGCFYLTPFVVASAALLPLAIMRSRWLRLALFIPAASLILLVVDAFIFQHRLAVTAHSAHAIHGDFDPKILLSPSGKTTAYVMTGGFVDTAYYVCISSNHLLPLSHLIDSSDPRGPKSSDIIAKWNGPIFLAGDKLVSFAYDERSGHFIDQDSYFRGGLKNNDGELMKHIKSHEAFADYLLSLLPKQ